MQLRDSKQKLLDRIWCSLTGEDTWQEDNYVPSVLSPSINYEKSHRQVTAVQRLLNGEEVDIMSFSWLGELNVDVVEAQLLLLSVLNKMGYRTSVGKPTDESGNFDIQHRGRYPDTLKAVITLSIISSKVFETPLTVDVSGQVGYEEIEAHGKVDLKHRDQYSAEWLLSMIYSIVSGDRIHFFLTDYAINHRLKTEYVYTIVKYLFNVEQDRIYDVEEIFVGGRISKLNSIYSLQCGAIIAIDRTMWVEHYEDKFEYVGLSCKELTLLSNDGSVMFGINDLLDMGPQTAEKLVEYTKSPKLPF